MIYEVNLSFDPAMAPTIEAWLHEHIDEMLRIEGFVDATWYELEPESTGYVRWTIHYRLTSREALQNYLDVHAERMRAEGLAKFGDHFKATRRILEPRGSFIPDPN